jgi:hypothetical protein
MATSKFSSREREGIYRLIILLNSSLQFIVVRLEEMASAKGAQSCLPFRIEGHHSEGRIRDKRDLGT